MGSKVLYLKGLILFVFVNTAVSCRRNHHHFLHDVTGDCLAAAFVHDLCKADLPVKIRILIFLVCTKHQIIPQRRKNHGKRSEQRPCHAGKQQQNQRKNQ